MDFRRKSEVIAASSADLQFLRGIELAAATLFSHADLSLALRQKTVDEGLLQRSLIERSLWVAKIQQEVVGFALAERKGTYGHLHELNVHPAHGRRGIGRELVETVIQWARQEKLHALTLNTFRHLPWNAPFYARLGFSEVPEDEGPAYLRWHAEAEARDGLNPGNRCAMWLSVGCASSDRSDSMH